MQLLFATLATLGATDEARPAWPTKPACRPCSDRTPACTLSTTGRAVWASAARLEKLQPFAKKAVIEGLVKTIAHETMLNVAEAELLRTVCACFIARCRRCCRRLR